MFAAYSLYSLVIVFLLAATVVWKAGIYLSDTTDVIDNRFGLGEAFGGLVLLALTTNLPEIAIVIAASLNDSVGIAIGNLLGGIAIQTVVLVILDGVGLGAEAALTFRASSLQIVLEGLFVIAILVIAIMGSQFSASFQWQNLAPGDTCILVTWLACLYLIKKSRGSLSSPQKKQTTNPSGRQLSHSLLKVQNQSTVKVFCIFVIAALATLVAGYLLEECSRGIAAHIGWSGILFGSTWLALVTSLPEISTGLAAVKMGDYTLAFSDIFGGNAFLPVLFLPATLLSGQPVLPQAQHTDIYLACLGVLLTVIYLIGLIFGSKKQLFSLGMDSWLVLLVYILGILGLFAISI